MPKILNLLLLIVGAITAGTGLATLHNHIAGWCVLVAGIAVMALACLSDYRRKLLADKRKLVASARRTKELTQRTWNPGDTLQVPASAWLIPGLLLLVALGAGGIYVGMAGEKQDLLVTACGSFFLGIGVLLLGRASGGLGRPALELTTSGITTSLNGRIAWRDISGIFLWTIALRSGRKSYRFMVRVNDFARSAERVHWTDRLLAAFGLGALVKGVVSVALPASKEDPQAIYALARRLWKQATGNDYAWNPTMSSEYNEASQRLGTAMARLNEPSAVEPSLANLQRVDQDITEIRRDMALMQRETKMRLIKGNRIIGLLVLLALLFTVLPLLLSLLK